MHYLKLCAIACQGLCESYKRLHQQSMAFCYSPIATQSLFLAGLTLIYCMWHNPDEVMTSSATNALTDCTIMLYVMTERWPTAQKYRNAFERVKTAVFEIIANGKNAPPSAVGVIDAETRTALDRIDSEFGDSVGMMGFSHMINDITGTSGGVVWEEDDFGLEDIHGFQEVQHGDDPAEHSFDDPRMEDFLSGGDVNGFENFGQNGARIDGSRMRSDFLDWAAHI